MTCKDLSLRILSPRVCKAGDEFNRRLVRGLVSVLQVIGLFPYRWPGLPQRPVFCVPLCLWSLFMSMFLTVGVYLKMCVHHSTPEVTSQDLNVTVFFIRFICEYIGSYMTCIFMLARSRGLARALEKAGDLFEREGIELRFGANHRVSCVAFLVILIIWGSQHVVADASIPVLFASVVVLSCTLLSLLGILFGIVLFKTLCAGMSNALLDTVNGLSEGPPTLVSGDVRNVFRLAEDRIRKIHQLRKEVASCFFEATSTLIIVTNVALLVLVYTAVVYGIQGGSAAVPVVCTACFGLCLCYVGQDFEDKVETAIDRLRDYKCKATDTELKDFAESLQRSLEPLQRFSMCGWYNLNKTLLLTLGSLVLTNLVVLLQIENSNSM